MEPPSPGLEKPYHRGRNRWFAIAAACASAVAWLRPGLVRVRGESMLPSLSPGDVLLVSRRWFGRPRRGRLVVVGRGGVAVVKRVSAGPGDEAMPGWILGPDQWLVLGDNREASTDSRSFGAIGTSDISGQVLLRLPRRRTGRSPQVLHR